MTEKMRWTRARSQANTATNQHALALPNSDRDRHDEHYIHGSETEAPVRVYTPGCLHGDGDVGPHTLRLRHRSGEKPPIPYDRSVGRCERAYLPVKKSRYGKGLCLILNGTDYPGINMDNWRLERFYQDELHYTVCGGEADPNKDHYRRLRDGDLWKIITTVSNQYQKQSEAYLPGAEYDRIIMHLLGKGDAECLVLNGEDQMCKVKTLDEISSRLDNLEENIPVSVFLHSYTGESESQSSVSSPSQAHTLVKKNIRGFFVTHDKCACNDTDQAGSKIVDMLVTRMKEWQQKKHLIDIVYGVNLDARRNRLSEIVTIDNGSKRVYLTMGEEFQNFHQSR